MPYVDNTVHDNGLDAGLQDIAAAGNADLHLCSQEPTTYTEAVTTYTLANKVDITITGPADGDVDGRKVTVSAISGGTVTGTDDGTHWAIVDTNTTTLLVAQALATTVALSSGSTFSLTAFDINKRDPQS